jgi:PAS domain S-box-containing protein
MKKHSENPPDWEAQRNKIIGLGETSIRKSYYPELQQRIQELEKKNRELQEAYAEHTAFEEELRQQYEEKSNKESERRESEAFLDSIIENVPLMLFVKDAADLRFVRFNRAGEDLLGYSREEMIGKNDHDFFPKDQADFFTDMDRNVLRAGKPVDIPEEKIETSHHGVRFPSCPVPVSPGSSWGFLRISRNSVQLMQHSGKARSGTALSLISPRPDTLCWTVRDAS